jgi:NADPH:quinone reductase-like Zn-dependent oxidoreductase
MAGVGHMAVQIGKALGLSVVGVAGPENLDFVKELGADEVSVSCYTTVCFL